jgi:hypothetical protein
VAGASDADQPGTKRQHVLRHCDADYFHQPHELNFWLPCTPAYGSNTRWLESEPGLGACHCAPALASRPVPVRTRAREPRTGWC